MRRTRLAFGLALAFVLMTGTPAWAHFLWLDPGKPGTGEHAVRLYFSETAEPDDARLLDRLGEVQAWARTLDGATRTVALRRAEDSLVANGVGQTPVLVGVAHTYGVTSRGNETFLLKYYAKTFRGGDAATWRQFKPAEELALEIVPRVDGKQLELSILWKGKPEPGAELVVTGPGLATLKNQTDDQGRFSCTFAEPGLYSIRARHIETVEGTYQGKAYASVRHYSTLALPFGESAETSAAVARSAEAGARMAAAHKARADWGSKFPGFTAKLEVNIDGKVSAGTVRVSRTGDTKVELADPGAAKWAESSLSSTVMHRNPGHDVDPNDDTYSHYRFAEPDESHPLGRLIAEDSDKELKSTYRVKGDQLLEVHRDTSKTRFTISVLDMYRNPDGRYLPRVYTVTYWNGETGKIERASTTRDEWTRVGDFDLPKTTLVIATSEGRRQVRQMSLTAHQLATLTSPTP